MWAAGALAGRQCPPEQLCAPQCHFFKMFFTCSAHPLCSSQCPWVWEKKMLLKFLFSCLASRQVISGLPNTWDIISILWLWHASARKTKSPVYSLLFNQNKSSVSMCSHSFEDTRLSSCTNRFSLWGLRALPAWSEFSSTQRPAEGRMFSPTAAKHKLPLMSASKTAGSAAIGWNDRTVTPYQNTQVATVCHEFNFCSLMPASLFPCSFQVFFFLKEQRITRTKHVNPVHSVWCLAHANFLKLY